MIFSSAFGCTPSLGGSNTIRSGRPGAWFYFNGERISILDADPVELDSAVPAGTVCADLTIACKTGGLKLNVLRRDGKKPLPAAEFLRGFDLPQGAVVGNAPL